MIIPGQRDLIEVGIGIAIGIDTRMIDSDSDSDSEKKNQANHPLLAIARSSLSQRGDVGVKNR